MIRKYLVVGRHVYISSKKKESKDETVRELEVFLPIEVFWKVEKILKDADYLIASGDENVSVQETYKLVLKKVSSFAVSEKDRAWLHDKVKSL